MERITPDFRTGIVRGTATLRRPADELVSVGARPRVRLPSPPERVTITPLWLRARDLVVDRLPLTGPDGRRACAMLRAVLRALMPLALASISAGCGVTLVASPSPQLVLPTFTPTAEIAPTVTDLPPATATFAPTGTPAPTETAAPTVTPQPTASPTALPTVTASPIPTPDHTPTAIVQLTPIQSITHDTIGQVLTLEGNVVETASFSAGFKYTLDDGTARIALLMWHSVFDDCWDIARINRGARVRVTGQVTEYEGQLEIQPRFGSQVKAIRPAPDGPAQREIGSLTGADAGDLVTIQGEVLRTEGLPAAVKVFVADDSGQILVFIWRNVLDRIVDNAGLGTPGSEVRIVGRLQIYRSNLELVPTLPHDVTVLAVP